MKNEPLWGSWPKKELIFNVLRNTFSCMLIALKYVFSTNFVSEVSGLNNRATRLKTNIFVTM